MNRVFPGATMLVRRSAILFLVLTLVNVSAARHAAGQVAPARLEVTSAFTDNWPVLGAAVSVGDASGQPISGLTSDAFSASVNGTPLAVTNVGTTSDPGLGIAVVLTFDVSGSMSGPPLEQSKTAGKALLAQLGPGDVAAIVSFSDAPAVVQGFTADHDALAQAIDGLAAGGNTALYSAVAQSVEVTRQAPLPRRAVVLLSDGHDFGGLSQVDPASTVSSVAASGALFFTVGLGADIDQEYLTQLAQSGHGQLLLAPTPDSLRGLYEAAGNVLRQQYVLRLDASSANLPAGNASLVISVNSGGAPVTGELQFVVPDRVGAPIATPQPTAAPTAAEVQTPVSGSHSSGFPWAIAVGAAALATFAAVGVGGLVLLRRRRPEPAAEAEAQTFERLTRAPAPGDFPQINRAVSPNDSPTWIEGREGERTALGDAPLTIGFSSDCGLYLPNGSVTHLERARVWQRDGHFMLHNLSKGGTVTVNGKPATWVVLEDGDEIVLGQCRLVFHDPR